jgi:hypothetical protein
MICGNDKINLKNKLNIGECRILECRESKRLRGKKKCVKPTIGNLEFLFFDKIGNLELNILNHYQIGL